MDDKTTDSNQPKWVPLDGQLTSVYEEVLSSHSVPYLAISAHDWAEPDQRYTSNLRIGLLQGMCGEKPESRWCLLGHVRHGEILGVHDGWQPLTSLASTETLVAVLDASMQEFPAEGKGPVSHRIYRHFLRDSGWQQYGLWCLNGRTPGDPEEMRWVVIRNR
jgi:hypothetical protein